jgi:hypothetical protein
MKNLTVSNAHPKPESLRTPDLTSASLLAKENESGSRIACGFDGIKNHFHGVQLM